MTTPQGPSGLNPGASWVVTGNDGSVSGLPARTQDNVTATLKTQMRQSNAWKGSSTAVWEGLRPGVPLTLATIEAIAKRLLGIDDKTWDTVESVLHDLQKVPILGDIIEVLTGIEDGDYNDLGTWVNRLLTGDSALNAANLFGLLDPSSLPAIEIGRLFKGEYGLIADGGFALPPLGSVDTGEWFWDNTIGVTANGCAAIIGDGATHDLIGQPIGVRAGQPFTFDTFVRWKDASVTAGSEPLQLLVIEFADRVQVGEVVIASVASTGDLLTFQRLDGGDYTVPDGVDSICPAVRVTSDLLAGNVWVDDAQNDTLGHILLSWIIGPDGGTMATLFDLFASMGELLNNTGTTQADWETWWHDLFVALGLGDTNSLTAANWLADAWFSIVHPIKVVLGLFVDMGDLLNDSTATQADWELWFSEVFSTVGMPTENASKAATWIADGWFSIVHPIRQILDQFSELQVLLNNPDAVQADWEDWLLGLFDLVIPGGTANAQIAQWLAKVWFDWIAPTKAAVDELNDSARRSINWVSNLFGLGYLNDAWVWTSGTPGVDDLPESGWSNSGGAPQSWLADILKAFGVPVGNDLPSQLDPSIPAAPMLGWPVGGLSSGTSVPQNTMLYYVATMVDTVTGKESAPSNEVMIWSMPSILGSKNQATLPWFTAPPAGKTISLYRRQSTTGQYRRVASGLTGTSYTDTDPGTTVTTQPGSAAASAAGVINGQFTAVNDNHQGLMDTIIATATDDFTLDDPDDPATKRPTVTGQSANDVSDTLASWPATHVSAPSEMSAWLLMQQTLSQIASGLSDTALDDVSPSDAGQVAQTMSQKVNLALLMGQMALLEGRARPIWRCGDPSSDPSIPSAAVIWNSASLSVPFPNGRYAVGGLIVTEAAGPRDYVSVQLNIPSDAIDVRLAIYYMNTAGDLVPLPGYTPIAIGPDISPSDTQPAGSQSLFKFSIPPIMVNPANVFAVELINMSTSVSLQMALGQVIGPAWWAIPGSAFVRTSSKINTTTPAVTIPRTSIAWNAMVPFVTLGYSGGGVVTQPDNVQEFTASGTWHPPSWWRPGTDYVDVAVLGGGGSGGTGITGAGNPGTASSVVVPGAGSGGADVTVTGPGGAAGLANTTTVANSTGESPGNRRTAAGRLLVGGGPASIVIGIATAGKAPGGGSSGAYFAGLYAYGGGAGGWSVLDAVKPNVSSLTVTVGNGGAGVNTGVWASLNGGRGKVWIVARQNRNA